MDALVEAVLKELLLDVALIGKYFAVEHLGEDLPHPRGPCRPRLRELGRT